MLRPFFVDAQHIPFLQHPAAESHSPENYLPSLAIHDPCALRPEESRGLGLSSSGREHQR